MHKCSRCGGVGGWSGWPDFTCFRCAGSGTDPYFQKDVERLVRGAAWCAKQDAKAAKKAAKQAALNTLPLSELKVVAVQFQCDETDEGRPVFDIEVLDKEAYDRAGGVSGKPVKCDCCGHALKYACLVEHAPSQKFYYVGRTCCASIECLKGSLNTIENASLVATQRAQCNAREANFRKVNPHAVAAYEWALNGANGLAKDIASKVRSYGISQPQANFLVNLFTEDERRRSTATGKALEGRHTVTGVIVGLKTVEGPYGNTLKAVVDLLNGVKAYGSVAGNASAEKGQKVTFTATFEPSKDNQLFGFWKRPAKWSVIDSGAVIQA